MTDPRIKGFAAGGVLASILMVAQVTAGKSVAEAAVITIGSIILAAALSRLYFGRKSR